MDFLVLLPYELLLNIFFYIDVREALRYREVSHKWNRVISSLTPYWQYVCSRVLGLRASTQAIAPLPSLASAALRHKKWIRTCQIQAGTFSDARGRPATGDIMRILNLRRFSRVQPSPVCSGFFLGYGYVLSTPDQAPYVRSLSTVCMNVCDYEPVVSSYLSSYSNVATASSQVVWGRATKDFLLLLTLTNEWICCSHYVSRVLLQWKGEPIFRQHHSRLDLLTHISCCDNCFLVVVAQGSSEFSPMWELRILKIGQGKAVPEGTVINRTLLIHLKLKEAVVHWLMLPRSTSERDGDGMCKEHTLLCQTETQIMVYKVRLDEVDIKQIIEARRVNIPQSDHHTVQPDTGWPSIVSVRLSSDYTLLASMVDPYHLYVWNTSTWDLAAAHQLHCGKLAIEGTDSSLASIIAVGHLYTVIGTCGQHFSIHIISTHSGELLQECHTKLCQWFSEKMIGSVALINEDCINNLYCFNSPLCVYVNSKQELEYFQFVSAKSKK